MPMFFFHVRDSLDCQDVDGQDLPDVAAARAKAVMETRQLMSETLKCEGRITLGHRIDVEDEHGTLVARVYFRDGLKIEE
jgi:hypothetical protein